MDHFPADCEAEKPFRTAVEWEAHLRFRNLLRERAGAAEFVREALTAPIDSLEDWLFGPDRVTVIDRALVRAFRATNRAARRALSPSRVLQSYRNIGADVGSLADLRALPLATLARVSSRVAANYTLAGSVSGGANGALGPAGALLGVSSLVGLSLAAINHHAWCFGYDTNAPAEEDFVILLLAASMVSTPSLRFAVVKNLEEVALALETPGRTQQVDGHQAGLILENVTEVVLLRVLLGVFGRSWPGIGLLLGAGFSRAFIAQVCETSLATYGQRWLLRKHGGAARLT